MKNKTQDCSSCGLKSITKNETGLCKKLLGEKTTCYFCLSCFAEYLDTTVDDLNAKIEEFMEQDCILFR
jgi:hypothetical protein